MISKTVFDYSTTSVANDLSTLHRITRIWAGHQNITVYELYNATCPNRQSSGNPSFGSSVTIHYYRGRYSHGFEDLE